MPSSAPPAPVLLVTGSRRWQDVDAVKRALHWAGGQLGAGTVLRHGAAPGADSIAAKVWRGWGGVLDPYPADWSGPCAPSCRPGHRKERRGGDTYCPNAGNRRNTLMCRTDPVPVLCLAFPLDKSSGTRDCITQAMFAGITVVHGERLEVMVPGAWEPDLAGLMS